MVSILFKSICIHSAVIPLFSSVLTAARPLSSLRAPNNIVHPLSPSCFAVSKPIPLFAPVINTFKSHYFLLFIKFQLLIKVTNLNKSIY